MSESGKSYHLEPIGYVSNGADDVPLFYTDSDLAGDLVIDRRYIGGIRDFQPGQELCVIFLFHKSPPFDESRMRITPPNSKAPRGVFTTRSPVRPNPLGYSVLEVLGVEENIIHVKGLDMLDGTPILDIKNAL